MPSILQGVTFDDTGVRSLTQRQIRAIIKSEPPIRYFYKEALKMMRRVAVHADGEYPIELIECRRPNEADEAKAYREKIWIEKTKPTFDRMMIFLNKIRRSQEWDISFKDESEFTRIKEGEHLSDYTERNYPGFTSVTNWIFKVVLKKYLIDPNAVLFVRPLETEIPETEHLEPTGTIYMSEDVIEVAPDVVILRNPEGAFYFTQGAQKHGGSFFVITETHYYRFDQINSKGEYAINELETFEHNLGVIPAFQLQGVVKDQYNHEILYESRIYGMIPELDEAVREYSDLQAAKVLHLYPERVEFTNTQCTACKGTGTRKVLADDGITKRAETCPTCEGGGYIVRGPYGKHIIKPAGLDEQALPSQPIQYVQKDIEIIKVQDESVEDHIYSGLAALNLEMISRTPLAESGKAKAYDADASNNTLHSIGEDIVYIMDRYYNLVARYRYSVQHSDDEIAQMLPSINVPERFDIATSGQLEAEVGSAKTNKLNPEIVKQLEIDFANKRFYNKPEIRERLEIILNVDPFANITQEEKNSMLQNKGITQVDYVLSSNIVQFVGLAFEQDAKFAEKTPEQQRAVLIKFAEDLVAREAAQGIRVPDDADFEEVDEEVEEDEGDDQEEPNANE